MTADAPSLIWLAFPAVMWPCLVERGAQPGERLDGGLAAHAFVVADHDRVAAALGDGDGHDLVVEDGRLVGRRRRGGAIRRPWRPCARASRPWAWAYFSVPSPMATWSNAQ